jgi:hypothetical protein
MQSSIAQWRDTVFFYFRKIIPKELDKKEKPKETGEKGRSGPSGTTKTGIHCNITLNSYALLNKNQILRLRHFQIFFIK